MILILVIGGGLGWKANRARSQRRAVAAVKAAGGMVFHDFDFPGARPPLKEPAAPKWLRKILGDEYFQEVELATFPGPVSGDDLAVIESFDRLRTFTIADSSKLGDGLAHLRGLRRLEHANLTGPGVTDAGLAHLGSLPALESITLVKTSVTDAGLVHLARLPRLQSLTLRTAPSVTDAGMASLASLPRLRSLLVSQAPRVTDLALEQLRRRLPEIEELGLDQTGITDAALSRLKEMPRLRHLQLQGRRSPTRAWRTLSRWEVWRR